MDAKLRQKAEGALNDLRTAASLAEAIGELLRANAYNAYLEFAFCLVAGRVKKAQEDLSEYIDALETEAKDRGKG